MAVKYKIKSLDEVSQDLRNLYRQEGSEYVLDVDGVVDRSRLDEFRNNNIQLQQQLEKLKDIDPNKYKEFMELDRKVKEKELIDKGDIEGLVNVRVSAMREELTTRASTAEGRLETAHQQLAILTIDNNVRAEAIKQGVLPTAVDDVILRARNMYKMVDGVATPMQDDKVVFGKDGSTPMQIGEWLTSLKKGAPHLFQMSSGGGAGGGTGHGSVDVGKMSPAQKIAYGLSLGLQAESQMKTGLPT